jgi:hypothetical protein
MLNLALWLITLAGLIALIAFAWRSAMRRRGFKLLKLLEPEQVLRSAVEVPVVMERGKPGRVRPGLLARRGTVVLTRKRLAGFAHRARFVLVRAAGPRAATVRADNGWLVIQPDGKRGEGGVRPAFRYQVPDAEGWSREARKVLRLR